ncbi:MAG: asparagine--tRNA ligase [Ruminococcaceae bacterium]|nr:asparagine--tRNA ligase [Oscillospiraceae bacterium]
MKITRVCEIQNSMKELSGKIIRVCGWVKTSRESKTIGFVEINDGSSFENLQCVLMAEEVENFKKISNASVGSSICVTGELVLTPESKQPFELKVIEAQIMGGTGDDYPLQKKRHSLEFLRTITHLRPRTNTFNAVFRVRSETAIAIHKFFYERGFIYVHTPIITGSDCEGAGAMFHVTTLDMKNTPVTENGDVDFKEDFFGREANLTVSGQLEAEGFALAFGKVYTFGPTFRAENSNTPRHAAEFWMIEPEMAFCDINDNMDIAEDLIKYIINHLEDKCPSEISFFNKFYDKELLTKFENIKNSEFVRIDYTEAIEILENNNDNFVFKAFWGCDLQTEHERYLTEIVFGKPVFVINYPKEIKSFYMRLNNDGKTVSAMDMLVPGIGELIGGSQREERYEVLVKRIDELGLNSEDYEWYVDLRRHGSVVHSGFGLGFERLIMYVTGISNIRDVLPYPRTAGGF